MREEGDEGSVGTVEVVTAKGGIPNLLSLSKNFVFRP